MPSGSQTSGIEGVDIRVAKDLVELDYIRAELGLISIDVKLIVQNKVWRGLGAIAKAATSLARQAGLNPPHVAGGAIRQPIALREFIIEFRQN